MGKKELTPDSILYGKYKIEKVLGSGGFGITYYAKHITLDQYYAIKEFFINGSCVRNTDRCSVKIQGIEDDEYAKYKKKFIDEARTLAKLDHPNIVKVIDVFEENNTSYLVMPFIKGATLQSYIEKHGAMEFDDAINFIAQISEAVGYIHKRSILHLDIKPENIIITLDNRAILIDFGSAREYVQDKTQNFTAILTKGYAPLEQYDSNKTKGAYSDIYSLGGVAYFILTGTKPLDAPNRAVDDMPIPSRLNSKIPKYISDVIMHAMELQTDKRYQTAKDFLDCLLSTPTRKAKKTTKVVVVLLITVCVCAMTYYWCGNMIKTDRVMYNRFLVECDSLLLSGEVNIECLPTALEKCEEALSIEEKYFGLIGFDKAKNKHIKISAEIDRQFKKYYTTAKNAYGNWQNKKYREELEISKNCAKKALMLKDDELMKKIINTNIE